MKRASLNFLLLLAALFGVWPAAAQDWAKAQLAKSPRHSEWVTVKHETRAVETFVVYPESKDKRPVVLVIHEIFGMTDWVEDLADQVAAAGYIAVAPDLLSGMGPNGGRSSSFAEGKTMEAVSKLNPDQVTADLNAAADYALKIPGANGKLFVAGFCWGGGQTFRFATNRRDFVGGVCILWPATGQGRDRAHQGSDLRFLCRRRRAHWRNRSRHGRSNESGGQGIRAGDL